MKRYLLIPTALALPMMACSGGGGDNASTPPVRVNTAPTLSVPADETLTANQSGKAVTITVADEEPDRVSVTAVADDEQLVLISTSTSGGSGSSRTFVLTPAEDMAGATVITVTATDRAGLQAQARFAVEVAPEERSMQQFARSVFSDAPDGAPELINAVSFIADAEDDDFADLLQASPVE